MGDCAPEAGAVAGDCCAHAAGVPRLMAKMALRNRNFFTLDLNSLRNKPLGNRKRPSKSKGPRRYLKPRSSLLTFVLGPVDKQGNVSHELQVEPIVVRNFPGAAQILDVSLQDTVKNIIGRQAVLVFLIGTQLRGRDLVDGRAGN